MREDRDRKKRTRVTRRSGTGLGGSQSVREQDRRQDHAWREEDRAETRREYRDHGEELRRDGRDGEDRRDRYEDIRRHDRYEEDRRYDRREEEPRRERREQPAEEPHRHTSHHGNPDRTIHQLMPYALMCLAPFAALSFVLRDVMHLDGSTGAFGNFLANFLCGLFGVVGYALPLVMLILAIRWRRYVVKGKLAKKLILSTAFLFLLSGIIHVFKDPNRAYPDTVGSVLYANGVAFEGGGFFGGFVGEWLGYCLRLWGTCLIAIPLLIVIGIYFIDMTPHGLWERISIKLGLMRERREGQRRRRYDGEEQTAGKRAQKSAQTEQRAVPEQAVTEPEIGWCQPRPLDDAPAFHEPEPFRFAEEEDVPFTPVKNTAKRQEDAEVIDLPEDVEEAVAEAAILKNDEKAQAAPAEPDPVDVLREAAEAVAAEEATPAVTPEQAPVYRAPDPTPVVEEQKPAEPVIRRTEHIAPGEVYAPFALPARPFPSAQREAASEQAEPTYTSPFSAERKAPTEEVLGFGESRRDPQSVQPPIQKAAPMAEPVSATRSPLFASVEEQKSDVAPERGVPVAPFGAMPSVPEDPVPATHTPVAAFEPMRVSAESPMHAEQTPVPPRSTFEPTKPAATAGGFSFLPDTAEEETPIAPSAPVAEQKPIFTPPVEEQKSDVAPERGVPVAPFGAVPSVEQKLSVEEKPVTEEKPTPMAPKPVFTPKPKPAPKPEPKPDPEEEPPAAPYCPPPLHLLDEPKRGASEDHSAEIEEKISILRTTLEDFHIHIKEQVDYSRGPTITRYEVRPEGGVSVRQFQNRADDISMYMSAPVRIAPVPGKPAVGIEVPNTVRDMVHIRTMLESEQFRNSQKLLEVPLGLGIGGEYQFCDIASMPHLLIAGSTGSGKSVCINTILLSLIYKTTPEDLRLILIDPKQVEFTPYEHIPHLYMPIINDMQRASGALACAVQEMERRFSIMRDVETRDIARYNEKVKNDPEREHLPRIVIIIDEFAELKMNSTNNDPEVYACRIAQKARAAGIHLIIGTQRPSVDVITGVLKANIGSRIAFSVRSQIDSRTILDSVGAEMLAGKGDMLFAPSNSTEKNPRRIQGAFVSDEELGRVVDYVIRHNDPVRYNKAFMERIEMEVARAIKAEQKGDYDDASDEEGGEDPKFIEAVQLAVETQKVATSLLQRRLGVGYGRAAKIIDRMEELGLVTAAEGNKPRKLLPAAQGYLDHIAGGAGEYGEEDYGGEDDIE